MAGFISTFSPNIFFGSVLLILNFPLGWIALAYCANLAKRSQKAFFYYVGAAFYAFSWVMFFAGILLCGKDYAKALSQKVYVPVAVITLFTIVIAVLAFNYLFAKNASKINKKAA